MTQEMPKFDFSEMDIKSETEFEAAAAEEGTNKRTWFDPGKYDVVIDEIEYQGAPKGDSNWGKLAVTFKGTGERSITSFVLLPFRDIKYGKKKTLFPFKQFKQFCSALGNNVTIETLPDTMKQVFSRPEKLKGATLSIEVGFRKGFVKYAGKTADGQNVHKLHTQDGNVVCDSSNQPILFPDRAAAFNYATENNIAVDEYANVLNYSAAATGSGLQTTNW